jgi:prohibitin 1
MAVNYRQYQTLGFLSLGAAISLLLVLFPLRPFVIIPAGERGVVLNLGKVQNDVLGEGFHPILPLFTRIKKMSVRIEETAIEETVGTKDLQTLNSKISVTWHLLPEKVNKLYQEIGDNQQIASIIITPVIRESVKASTPTRTAEEILKQRENLKLEIEEKIKGKLDKYGIIVNEVALTNLSFSDEFKASIERKQIAEQDRETAKREAEAEIIRAKGKAEAQKLLKQSLNAQLLQKQAIEKWDGRFPTVMGGNGSIPLINIDPSQVTPPKQ